MTEAREVRDARDALAPAPAATGRNLVSVALAVVGATAGLLFGYDTGVVSGAMLLIRSAGHASRRLAPSRQSPARSWLRRLVLCRRPEMSLENKWHEYIVSGTVLAAWVFSFVGGWAVGESAREPWRSRC